MTWFIGYLIVAIIVASLIIRDQWDDRDKWMILAAALMGLLWLPLVLLGSAWWLLPRRARD